MGVAEVAVEVLRMKVYGALVAQPEGFSHIEGFHRGTKQPLSSSTSLPLEVQYNACYELPREIRRATEI
jgi:hypothetical protein